MQGVSLNEIAEQKLDEARASAHGRSSATVHGGRQHDLRQTLIALAEGHALGEHESPGEATLQVLLGRVRLASGDDSWEGAGGDFLVIPPTRHDLTALVDSVVLLTVATRAEG